MSSGQRRLSVFLAAAAALFLLGSGIVAQTAGIKQVGAQTPNDEEFARLVREWTTRPEFSSPLVDHLPKVVGVPSPKDGLGHYIGEPRKLTYYADILKYYRALAAASPRVKVMPNPCLAGTSIQKGMGSALSDVPATASVTRCHSVGLCHSP